MRLAILTPRRRESIILINHLTSLGLSPDLVVFHMPRGKGGGRQGLLPSLKAFVKRNLLYFSDRERIRRIRTRNLEEANRIIEGFAREKGLSDSEVGDVRTCEVTDINGPEAVRILKEGRMDILFIWGVPIVREAVIDSAAVMVVNAHSSILPEYRGSKSEFWQFHNDDFTHAGITLHRVDKGVDTGDILMQAHARSTDLVNPEVLHAWNVVRVFEGLPELLARLRDGSLTPWKQSDIARPKTKTYRMRDIGIGNLGKVYLGR